MRTTALYQLLDYERLVNIGKYLELFEPNRTKPSGLENSKIKTTTILRSIVPQATDPPNSRIAGTYELTANAPSESIVTVSLDAYRKKMLMSGDTFAIYWVARELKSSDNPFRVKLPHAE